MSNDDTPPVAEDVPSRSPARPAGSRPDPALGKVIRSALRRLGLFRNGEGTVRDTLDELIEAGNEADEELTEGERTLLANILGARGRPVEDVMVPRADIVAVESHASFDEVTALMIETGHSRLPVYRETLDDAVGMVHIKDMLAWRNQGDDFHVSKLVRRVLFVAPSMEVLHLLLEMRANRTHMALVVDEFGGVDGIVTIEDLVEEIVGDIADEHDKPDEPAIEKHDDGAFDVDARAPLDDLEEYTAGMLTEEEREEVDTLGGLVVSLAGRVPIRGELIRHPSGLEFEVLEADPRRIKRVRIRREEPSAQEGISASGGGR